MAPDHHCIEIQTAPRMPLSIDMTEPFDGLEPASADDIVESLALLFGTGLALDDE